MQQQPPSSRRSGEDSGLIDLDALMSQASQARELEEAGTSPPKPPALPVSQPSSASPMVVVTAVVPSPSPIVSAPPPPPPPRKRPRSRALLISIVSAGLAAACITYVTTHRPSTSSTTAAAAAAAVVAAPAKQVVAEIAPAATPVAALETTTVAVVEAAHVASPHRVAVAAAAAPVAPTSDLQERALPVAADTEDHNLGDAMRSAVGDRKTAENADNAKSASTNAAQVRPSPGAVVGALGSVLPSARACLGPDDPIRNGLVTFRSDGSVATVNLAGPKKPTDDCVRSELSKAKVAPFLDEQFVARVTVRP